jgi:hypothetical protein
MTKSLIQKMSIALLIVPFLSFYASAKKPVEAFIDRVRQTNNFVEVSNIWQTDNNADKTEVLKNVEKAQLLTIDFTHVAAFIQKKQLAISLVIPAAGGGTHTIELAQYNSLANNFEVHERGANNSDKLFDYTAGLYYSGVVKGRPGSVASFSFFNNEVYGVFSIPGEGNFIIVPNTIALAGNTNNSHYILYNDLDLKITDKAPRCGVDDLPDYGAITRAHKTTTTLDNKVYNSCTEIRVMEVADYDFYTKLSNNTANVTNYVTAIFNNQATLYRNEGIPIVLKYLQVNTTSDEYMTIATADIFKFLKMLGGVTQNVLHGCDLAMLLTTRYGSMGGVAWTGRVCNSYSPTDSAGPYAVGNYYNVTTATPAFPTYSWNVKVLAHEMGHLLSSPHTHKCVWNPPVTGTTAIDGCDPVTGSCADPGYPTGGGTIMSYCHKVASVGVNFSNGFGTQPGDLIRDYMATKFSTTCGGSYFPQTVLAKAATTITANRECEDITTTDTTTYYWYDNNTADHADDTLVLAIKKHGNNIGTLNSATFSVKTVTLTGWGTGTGQAVTFPTSLAGVSSSSKAFRRYWQMTAATEPTTPVDVLYPYTSTDSADVDGSFPGTLPTSAFRMYKVNGPTDPNPANPFTGAAASAFTIYTYSTTPTTTKWTKAAVGTAKVAQMKMTKLSGGGTGFYSLGPTGVSSESGIIPTIQIFPNPTGDVWNVDLTDANESESIAFNLYAADGRIVRSLILKNGSNEVRAGDLANGVYFYRIITTAQTYTGNLQKN